MITDLESFERQLSLSKVDTCRELYRQNRQLIRIKDESLAARNLVRIIESTLRLAGSKGFHAMSLRDLSADCGFSIGGLYAYIRGKDDLLGFIQGHGFLVTRRTLLAYTQGIVSPHERLLAAVKAHVYLSEIMQPWFYFSFMETRSLPRKHKKQAIAMEREVEDIFYAIIAEGIGSGTFRQVDGRLASSLCKAIMQDWYLKRRNYRDRNIDATQYAEFVGTVLERFLIP